MFILERWHCELSCGSHRCIAGIKNCVDERMSEWGAECVGVEVARGWVRTEKDWSAGVNQQQWKSAVPAMHQTHQHSELRADGWLSCSEQEGHSHSQSRNHPTLHAAWAPTNCLQWRVQRHLWGMLLPLPCTAVPGVWVVTFLSASHTENPFLRKF